MSYAELDARANQLAHRLVGLGVGPEVPVGVLMPRSLDLVVAMLGVLKAGGAYVPMDPAYPADRLAMMIEDTEVRRRAIRLGSVSEERYATPRECMALTACFRRRRSC